MLVHRAVPDVHEEPKTRTRHAPTSGAGLQVAQPDRGPVRRPKERQIGRQKKSTEHSQGTRVPARDPGSGGRKHASSRSARRRCQYGQRDGVEKDLQGVGMERTPALLFDRGAGIVEMERVAAWRTLILLMIGNDCHQKGIEAFDGWQGSSGWRLRRRYGPLSIGSGRSRRRRAQGFRPARARDPHRDPGADARGAVPVGLDGREVSDATLSNHVRSARKALATARAAADDSDRPRPWLPVRGASHRGRGGRGAPSSRRRLHPRPRRNPHRNPHRHPHLRTHRRT